MKRLICTVGILMAFVLAGCTANTIDPTNVTSNGATLRAAAHCEQGESGHWWFIYKADGGSWQATPHQPYNCSGGPMNGTLPAAVTLSPDTHYVYLIAGDVNGGQVLYADSQGTANTNRDFNGFVYDEVQTPPTTPPDSYPSLTGITFDGDFDTGGVLVDSTSPFAEGSWPNSATDSNATKTVNTSTVFEGTHSMAASATSAGSTRRAEVETNTFNFPTEVWYEFLVYVPSGVPQVGYLAQNKQGEGPSCANGGVSFDSTGHLILKVRYDCNQDYQPQFDYGVMPKDRWVAVKVHERFVDNNTGFAEFWVENDAANNSGYQLVGSQTGIDTVSGIDHVEFRLGRYGTASSADTIYEDGYHLKCVSGC